MDDLDQIAVDIANEARRRGFVTSSDDLCDFHGYVQEQLARFIPAPGGAALVRQFNEWTPPTDCRVTPSVPETRWLFEERKMDNDLQHMPPGERAAFAAGFRRGHEVATNEVMRLRSSFDTPSDTLQSQLDFVAPYYSPVADAKARITELEAVLREIASLQIEDMYQSDPNDNTAAVLARAALSKGLSTTSDAPSSAKEITP